MSSQGQRFRRRALRRGYKVDEVDAFLDRVEETLNGDPDGTPVTAQEVHDVVFRVRFGGYDEWQVDLHLDRVERQIAELEERGYGRELRMYPPDRIPPPERMAPDRMPPDRMGPPPERMGPPRDSRMGPPPMPPGPPLRPAPPMPAGPPPGYERYEEAPAGRGYEEPFEPGRHGKADMTTEIRMPDRGFDQPYQQAGPPLPPEAQRVDQMRRTFQLRRYGSGYDRVQVDRLFDNLVTVVAGRSPRPVTEAELAPGQFNLVPGGYFEAEVDAALKEVRDLLMRRR